MTSLRTDPMAERLMEMYREWWRAWASDSLGGRLGVLDYRGFWE